LLVLGACVRTSRSPAGWPTVSIGPSADALVRGDRMHAWLSRLDRYFPIRYTVWSLSVLSMIGFAIYWHWTGTGDVAAIVCGVLVAVGIRDMLQSKHSVLRNYPLIGHIRF